MAEEGTDVLTCPHCGEQARNLHDSYCDITTYWGESNPSEVDCDSCGETVYVWENVTRWWAIAAKRDGA